MKDINLLPWREKRQSQQKKIFCMLFFAVLFMTLLLLFFSSQYLSRRIKEQSLINLWFHNEISQLEIQIAKMERAKGRIASLHPHIKMLERLNMEGRILLHLFPELMKILPYKIYLSHLKRHEDSIQLDGYAESEEDIAKLMVAIPNNSWMQKPVLQRVIVPNKEWPYAFRLQFTLKPMTSVLRPSYE